MSEHILLLSAIFSSALWGLLGALARVLISLGEAKQLRRAISMRGFALYAFVILVTGAFVGIVFNFGKAGSFIGGYAGLDLMEALYKTFKSRKIEAQESNEKHR